MRILYVIHQFYPEFGGGTEHVTLNLARMAQRAGHHVQVLACGVQAENIQGTAAAEPLAGCVRTVHHGVPVVFLPRTALPNTAEISLDSDSAVADAVAGWMKAQAFDVVHVMHTMRMGSAVLAIQRSGLPYLVTATDFYLPCAQINLVTVGGKLCPGPDRGARCSQECLVPPWTEMSYSVRFQQASALLAAAGTRVAPSAYVARKMRDCFPELDFRVVPHGIDLLRLASASEPAGPETTGSLRLAWVGSIIRQKGLDTLLDAMSLLKDAPIELTVIGGFFGDPSFHTRVRHMTSGDARIRFAGKLNAREVFAHLQGSDLLCLTSRVPESFSLALHESAAAGVPALVSNLGAPADFVSANACGQTVAPDTPKAWADALAGVLENRKQIAAWRERLPLPFRIEEEAFLYESLYRQLRRRVVA